MSHARKLIFILPAFLAFWVGFKVYSYFFDISQPTLAIYGIENEHYYGGDVQCKIEGKDKYKVDYITIWLDGKPLVPKHKVSRKRFEYNLPLITKTLSNGKHDLKIYIVDSSYNKNDNEETISFYVDNTSLQAAFIRPDSEYKVFQGRTLHIQFQANKTLKNATINILSKDHICYEEMAGSNIYECFVPIDCEENPNEYPFVITAQDFVGNSIKLDGKVQIMPYPFKKQILNISQEKVKEEQEIGIPQLEFEQQMETVSKQSPNGKLWNGTFYVPIEMTKVTCDYGTIRTTQQKGCYMHKALDLIGIPRSVVWAPQDGIVVIKDRFVQSGNTVVIDHGCGVTSLLFHLEHFADIKVGDKIKRGNPVGTIGKTGFATGYHLHWEMRINNIPTDPMQWTKTSF